MSVKVYFLLLQIYTLAHKIAVLLQMLCAWSAHCFVCLTNYQLPTSTRPTWPAFLLTPPDMSSKSVGVTQEKAILSLSWISFERLLCFSDFLWAHIKWAFAYCMKILRFTNCKNVCATSTFQLVLPSTSCLSASRSLSVRHLLDHSQADTSAADT